MKRLLVFTIACLASGLGTTGESSAQLMDISADLHRKQEQMMNNMKQQIAEIQRKEAQILAQLIRDYRQRTGDQDTPDAQVWNLLLNAYYAQNPAAYRQKIAEDQYVAEEMRRIQSQIHADNLAGFRARSQIIANTASEINTMSMDGFNNRMASMDRMQVMNVNGIYEQSRYHNPVTGQTVDLSFHPNQWQFVGGQYYFTDGWGRQFAYSPGYGFQQLSESSH